LAANGARMFVEAPMDPTARTRSPLNVVEMSVPRSDADDPSSRATGSKRAEFHGRPDERGAPNFKFTGWGAIPEGVVPATFPVDDVFA